MRTKESPHIEVLLDYISENRELATNYCNQVFNINKMTETDVFYSMLFCLLVPGGRAKRTAKAVEWLRNQSYHEKYIHVKFTDEYLYKNIKSYVRFPNQKIKRIQEFKEEFFCMDRYCALKTFINAVNNPPTFLDMFSLRTALVKQINGLGYKAASHFLRNMGAKNLAVIDTHILKYLDYFAPKIKDLKPNSRKNYISIEHYFNKWAEELDLQPAVLDYLIWCKESDTPIDYLRY